MTTRPNRTRTRTGSRTGTRSSANNHHVHRQASTLSLCLLLLAAALSYVGVGIGIVVVSSFTPVVSVRVLVPKQRRRHYQQQHQQQLHNIQYNIQYNNRHSHWHTWNQIQKPEGLRAVYDGDDDNGNNNGNNNDDDESSSSSSKPPSPPPTPQMYRDFYFDVKKSTRNMDKNGRSSMDSGIHEMVSGGNININTRGGAADFTEPPTTSTATTTAQPSSSSSSSSSQWQSQSQSQSQSPTTVVVIDWECLLDALPYHVELGIHAARTVWPHLNDLCNFDSDRQWLENKLCAVSHVLGGPGDDAAGNNNNNNNGNTHVACEFALATRLILEEQALDRNESTGKNGKYSQKFHPRSEINGSDEFRRESPSRRPLTAGELAVNWREFIRSTLVVKYTRELMDETNKNKKTNNNNNNNKDNTKDATASTEQQQQQQEPQESTTSRTSTSTNTMELLENAIEEYLETRSHTNRVVRCTTNSNSNSNNDCNSSSNSNNDCNNDYNYRKPIHLPLFPQTKFALRNSSTKIVVRISHRFDNELVARNLNKQLRLSSHERIAKTYKPENAVRRLFLNEDKNMVLLLRPDYDDSSDHDSDDDSDDDSDHDSDDDNDNDNGSSDEECGTHNKYESPGDDQSTQRSIGTEESCLRGIMDFTHDCDNRYKSKLISSISSSSSSSSPTTSATTTTSTAIGSSGTAPAPTPCPCPPSVVWIDSSWHRLQTLVPVFGDALPGLWNARDGKKNAAKCRVRGTAGRAETIHGNDADDNNDNGNGNNDNGNGNDNNDASVWLSLYLAEWPALDTASGSTSTSTSTSTSRGTPTVAAKTSAENNHQAAMVYPWTDCLSWDDAEDSILLPTNWGLSDTAFQ